jgi:hypothetical protein
MTPVDVGSSGGGPLITEIKKFGDLPGAAGQIGPWLSAQ